jgi:hypothetical protein
MTHPYGAVLPPAPGPPEVEAIAHPYGALLPPAPGPPEAEAMTYPYGALLPPALGRPRGRGNDPPLRSAIASGSGVGTGVEAMTRGSRPTTWRTVEASGQRTWAFAPRPTKGGPDPRRRLSPSLPRKTRWSGSSGRILEDSPGATETWTEVASCRQERSIFRWSQRNLRRFRPYRAASTQISVGWATNRAPGGSRGQPKAERSDPLTRQAERDQQN